MDLRGPLLLAVTLLALPNSAAAADTRERDTIDVLIVSDGVNPHGLPPESLTEPGELETALLDPSADWGLPLGAVDEVSSQCVDEALDLLGTGDVDVVIYFAHRAAQTCDGRSVQALLTTLMQRHLQQHGGVVVFHHGVFEAPGKTQLLELLGASAERFEWFPEDGQAVINVAPGHFVTTHDVDYASSTPFEAPALGVRSATYPSFINAPDERYPELTPLTQPSESRTPLFASDYEGAQLLGYDLHRPDWKGHVVMYQPGEHQPHALGPGPNRQILANAIFYAATAREGDVDDPEDPEDPTSSGDSADAPEDSDGEETVTSSGPGASSGPGETESLPTSGSGPGGPTSGGTGRGLGPSGLRANDPPPPQPPAIMPTAQPRAPSSPPQSSAAAGCNAPAGRHRGGGFAWLGLLALFAGGRRLRYGAD